jgi:hypothetical protein
MAKKDNQSKRQKNGGYEASIRQNKQAVRKQQGIADAKAKGAVQKT